MPSLPPVLSKSSDLVEVTSPDGVIQGVFLVQPFFARMVRLRLLHEVGEGVTHTAFAHFDGEIIGDPRPFRFHRIAVVELELMLAFKGAAVVLLKDGGRAFVIRVHKLAVDTVEHIIL